MARSPTIAVVVAALLWTPAGTIYADSSSSRHSGVRLPLLGPDREPVDLLRRSAVEVERILEERDRHMDERRRRLREQPVAEERIVGIPDPSAEDKEPEPPTAAEAVEVKWVWVGESLPGEGTADAEMALHNTAGDSFQLLSVYTDAAVDAMLHATVVHGGVYQARRVQTLYLPPDESVTLQSGGPRLMLVDLRRPLTRGEVVYLVLNFDDGSRKTVEAPVRSAAR